jgi:hypothetical protein
MKLFHKLAICFSFLAIFCILAITKNFLTFLPTGKAVLLSKGIMLAILVSFSFLILALALTKEKVPIPFKELEQMLYKIDEIEKSNLSEENKAKKLVKYLLPDLHSILTYYKSFVHGLPSDYRNVFYDVYSSLKHPHYLPQRLMKDARYLKEVIKGLINKYKF